MATWNWKGALTCARWWSAPVQLQRIKKSPGTLLARRKFPILLVDARSDQPEFDILRHGTTGYSATRKSSGWIKSRVFAPPSPDARMNDLRHPTFSLSVARRSRTALDILRGPCTVLNGPCHGGARHVRRLAELHMVVALHLAFLSPAGALAQEAKLSRPNRSLSRADTIRSQAPEVRTGRRCPAVAYSP